MTKCPIGNLIKHFSFFLASIKEDFCGVEPVTHPPPMVETKPPPKLDKDKVDAAYNKTNYALIGGKHSLFHLYILFQNLDVYYIYSLILSRNIFVYNNSNTHTCILGWSLCGSS